MSRFSVVTDPVIQKFTLRRRSKCTTGSGVFFGGLSLDLMEEPGPKKTPDPFDSMAALGQLLDFGQ